MLLNRERNTKNNLNQANIGKPRNTDDERSETVNSQEFWNSPKIINDGIDKVPETENRCEPKPTNSLKLTSSSKLMHSDAM